MINLGIDNLLKKHKSLLKNKRLGLLAHPASVNSSLTHSFDILNKNQQLKITHLYGPEHGLWGSAQDMIDVESFIDPVTKLPVTSLYGKTFDSLKPKEKDLEDIDILICDLQDIGSRYYTYIYTIAFCMQACAQFGKKVIVLDRPNPINGLNVEGKILKKGFESFVGLYPIPIRHGMTMGELALFFNKEENIECDLTVVKMDGWKRKHFFNDTRLPWVLPSPNMPTLNTALIYPGLCLIEATHLSEGRGTTKPFEFVGAPYIDPFKLAGSLTKMKLPGVLFRPTYFRPTYQKWAHQDCGGIQIHITDQNKLKPVKLGIAILKAVIDLYPNDFAWRDKAYEFVADIPAIDLLSGDEELRTNLNKSLSLNKLVTENDKAYKHFLKLRSKYLLYS